MPYLVFPISNDICHLALLQFRNFQISNIESDDAIILSFCVPAERYARRNGQGVPYMLSIRFRQFTSTKKTFREWYSKHRGEANTNPRTRSTLIDANAEEVSRSTNKLMTETRSKKKKEEARRPELFFLIPFPFAFTVLPFSPFLSHEQFASPHRTHFSRFEGKHSVTYLACTAAGETSSFASDGGGGCILGYVWRHTLKAKCSCEVRVNGLSAQRRMTSLLAEACFHRAAVGKSIPFPNHRWKKM